MARVDVSVDGIPGREQIRLAQVGLRVRIAKAHGFQRRDDSPSINGDSDPILDPIRQRG
jgi:hypothetical protein